MKAMAACFLLIFLLASVSAGNKPTILYASDVETAPEGQRGGLICIVRNQNLAPSGSFAWYKLGDDGGSTSTRIVADGNSSEYGQSNRYEGAYQLHTHVLMFYSAKQSYSGTYRCQVTPELYADSRLDVL